MKNKVLAMLLALCMVMSLLPVSVFATDDEVVYNCTSCGCVAVAAPDADDASVQTVETPQCTYTLPEDDDGEITFECAHNSTAIQNDETGIELPSGCLYTICRQYGCAEENNSVLKKSHKHVCDDCGCSLSACTECGDEEAGGCSCAGGPLSESGHTCGASGCRFYLDETVGCEKWGEIVAASGDGAHTHKITANTVGNCKGETGKVESGSAADAINCALEHEHDNDCPKKCPVEGCTETKGHTTPHVTNTACTNDDKCAMDADTADNIKKHVATCPAVKNVSVANTAFVTWTGTYTYEVACEGSAETDGHTENAQVVKIPVSVLVGYDTTELDPKEFGSTELYKEAIAQAEKAALAGYTLAQDVKDALEEKWDLANPGPHYCKACAAAQDDPTADCTKNFDCPSDEHKDDCLKACTHSPSCPNTEGDATAHSVWYVVYVNGNENGNRYYTLAAAERAYKALKEDNDDAIETAERGLKTLNTALGELKDADDPDEDAIAAKEAEIAAAEASLDLLKANRYTVRAIHCEKAGIPDSTVVDAEGVVTPDPSDHNNGTTEEPKAPEKAEDLTDVDGTEWFAEELTALIKKGIFAGSENEDGTYSFNPKDEMNTDMLVVLVSRVLDKGLKTTGAGWADEAVAWAAEEGLTEGIESGKVTRGDVVVVLWRAAECPESEQDLSAFVDAEGLEGDQLSAMKWAVEVGIVKGNDKNELNADAVIIRSEMVAVIARFDGVVNK